VIDFKGKDILKCGRSNISDVRIPDISVSREHSLLFLLKGNIYIDDVCSKFGTLLQINHDLVVIPDFKLAVQIHKSLTKFSVKRTCKSFLMCYTYPSKDRDYNQYIDARWKADEVIDEVYKCEEAVYNEEDSLKEIKKLNESEEKETEKENKEIVQTKFDNLITIKVTELINNQKFCDVENLNDDEHANLKKHKGKT